MSARMVANGIRTHIHSIEVAAILKRYIDFWFFFFYRRARNGRRKSNSKSPADNASFQLAGFDLDLEPLNDQQQGKITSRRSNVPSYMNRQSPGVPPPAKTPSVYEPSFRPSIPLQSSPTINIGLSTPPPLPIKEPPEILDGFGDFTVHTSTYFEMEIPSNVFSDKEDGNTQDLSLKIMAIHPQISSKSWLKLSPDKLAMFGVAPEGSSKNRNLVSSFWNFIFNVF